MQPVLRRARRAAIHKLLSATFLCILGLTGYVAALAGGGWWLTLLVLTTVQGLDAQPPDSFFKTLGVMFSALTIIEWVRRRKKTIEATPENTPWIKVPMDLLLLGPGCLFSLWDLAGSARRLLFMDPGAIESVLSSMGTRGSIRVSKLNGVIGLAPDALQRAIHALQLLDLIYLTERDGALVLAANDGPGKSLCRNLRIKP